MATSLCDMSIAELAPLLKRREITSEEITSGCLERIGAVEESLNAFTAVFEDSALREAREVDRRRLRNEPLPEVARFPVGIKDNIALAGHETTCCSNILAGYVSPFDATVVTALRRAGAVIIGTTNMDEFAMGSSCELSCHGSSRNPWDISRVPGGSSGGSAAAVAAGETVWALGSDTGGSVRQPASFCGVVGLKPTYGRVSRYGLVAFASSLDQVGPLTRTVEDAVHVFLSISQWDQKDSTSVDAPLFSLQDVSQRDISGFRIGIINELTGEGIDGAVRDRFWQGLGVLESRGAVCEEMSLPLLEYAMPVYYIIATAEASSNLARYDGIHYGNRAGTHNGIIDMVKKSREEGFGPEVKRRIMLGTYVLSAGYYQQWYEKALRARTLINKEFAQAFERFDCLVSPTTPSTAFSLDEKLSDPLTMYRSDLCTLAVNLAGLPGISVPCGLSGGLPVGIQIIAPAFGEETLFKVALAYEEEAPADFVHPRPPGRERQAENETI